MAQGKNNWLWWTLGGVALLGVGVGTYMYIKSLSRRSNEGEKSSEKPQPPVTSSTKPPVTSTTTSATNLIPFKNKSEGDAFRAWINDTYPEYARQIDLDRSGSYNNSYIQRAWNDYGSVYQNRTQSQTSNNSNVSVWSRLKNQMLDTNIWANNIRLSEDSTDKIRFAVNVDGYRDVYVNFTPSGGFWIEMFAGGKHGGRWSFSNGIFTLKMDDNSFNASDNEIGEMVKQVMKIKFPNEMKYFSFSENSDSIEDVLNMDGKKYVDSQDSML